MWKKFKELKLVFKIIVGIIAFIFLPVTLLLFAIELFIRSIKNKKIAGGIITGILSIILLFISSGYVSALYEGVTTDTTQLALEQKEKEEAEQARIQQDAKEKEEAEQKAKEEEAKNKAEEEQKAKQLEEQKKAEEDQKAKELAKKEAEEKAKKDDEQKTAEIKNTTTKNKSNYNNNSNSNNNSSEVVYLNGGSSKSNKYHSSANAHNMEGAIKTTLKKAKSQGYVACKRCY
ncbi:hypothetical protein L0P85_06905 [Terrisporobacter glycolicus]|nr:hypothetical protein L0P85_06905 [Terrisporobacter glycolicus]